MVLCASARAADYAARMRNTMWSSAIVGLALGSLAMVGGTAVGGELGPLAVGYGLLVALAALYLVGGLVIRERVWRRISAPTIKGPRIDRLAGPRVF
jgi:4-hydroxybenzoate polyprenyltransferase